MLHMVASLFFAMVGLAAAGLVAFMLADARAKVAAALGLGSASAFAPEPARRVRARARVVSVQAVRWRAAA